MRKHLLLTLFVLTVARSVCAQGAVTIVGPLDGGGNVATSATLNGAKTNDTAAPSTDFVPVLGAIASSAAQAYTTGRLVLPRTNLFGHFGVFFTDPTTGANLTAATDATHDSPALMTGPQLMGECDDVSTDPVEEGDAAKVRVDCTNRQLVTRILDPCSGSAKTTTPISLTTDTVIIAAVAAKKNYICHLAIVAAAAEIVSITEGTGAVCATSEAALVGSTTDANGMSFAANGGLVAPGGDATIIAGKTANVDTCLNVSGANRVSGWVTWVQAP